MIYLPGTEGEFAYAMQAAVEGDTIQIMSDFSDHTEPYPAMVYEYNGEYNIDKVVIPAEYYPQYNPQPQFDHCEYCGTKTFPTDRCCVACRAPV